MNMEDRAAPVAWPLALAGAAVLGTLATACMMPFVAIATIAAATMPRGQAVAAVLGVWSANQLLGFGWLGYPVDAHAIGWGAALGGAAIAAQVVARRVACGGRRALPRLALAFAAAFVAYEGLLFALAIVAGGTGTFTPAIVGQILANDAGWLVGLAALHAILASAAPRVFGRATALRLA
ncbi:hypothetical protein [Sphingomonas corticis]|jgi:hypothetical protein|uniref:Uncharacterized protein n=1 Tax=Sphingomonas corticis TaxID=2722791 RepID=A0ABX1CPU5_9SPHN|nr:hypothetical protein [Sphingomonas corticis]NJR79978.1 hypothetical protein [Sphingomonas corticis]